MSNKRVVAAGAAFLGLLAACQGALPVSEELGVRPGALVGASKLSARAQRLTAASLRGPSDVPPGFSVSFESNRAFAYVHVLGDAPRVGRVMRGLNGRPQSAVAGRYVTGRMPVAALRALARDPAVDRIELGEPVRMYNDLGNLAEGNASRTSAAEAAPPYPSLQGNGTGVLVCALDSGLDVTHPDFIRADGTTRVVRYWDQSDTTDFNAPVGYDYGREYSEAENQAAIAGGATAIDDHGHGTHVLGTIAGNGRGGALETSAYFSHYGAYQFTGVAPEADIAFVKFDFGGSRNTDTAIVEGVDWCMKLAAERGQPVSVNLSLGSDFGPHDGSTLEERALTELVGAGRLVAASAGNAGELGVGAEVHPHTHLPPADKIHGQFALAQGESKAIDVDLSFNDLGRNSGRGNDYVFFTFWYDASASLDLQVTTPSGATYSTPDWSTGGSGGGYRTPDGCVVAYNGGDQLGWDTDNGDHELYLEISDSSSCRNVSEGNYHLVLSSASGSAVINGWHGMSQNFLGSRVLYDDHATDNRMTIGSPATAAGLVSVGAYTTRNTWWKSETEEYGYDPVAFPAPLGDLAFFSSRGPDRNGGLQPDVSAPGVGIISSRSKDAASFPAGGDFTLVGEYYGAMQGTSMSSPNAAGAFALALARNPALDPAGLRAALAASSRKDDFVNNVSSEFTTDARSAPNNDWGTGKLDVPGLLVEVGCVATEPAGETSCDGLDNDCDGNVDEGLTNACGGCGTLAATPGDGCGPCGGTWQCVGDDVGCNDPGLNACGACGPVLAEACDGMDNNCDGSVDEGFGQFSCGVGACFRTIDECDAGTLQSGSDCVPGSPSAELCDDGVDNDCDGETDEDCGSTCEAPEILCADGQSCGLGNRVSCSADAECCSNKCRGGRCR